MNESVGRKPLQTRRSLGRFRLAVAAIALMLIGGCATLSPDSGFGAMQEIVKDHGGQEAFWARTDGDREAVQATVRQVLSRPLSADDAVRIALINNRGLQATYAELGIAETELVEANWPRNPGFTFSHLSSRSRLRVSDQRL